MAATFDEKSADIPRFDCFSDPATIGPRWTRWLNSFELYADGKGLIFDETETTANKKVKQRRRALLLHHAGQDVQDVFVTLAETGGVTDYEQTVAALNKYFVPKVNSSVARRRFKAITPSGTETVGQFATRLRKAVKDCEYGTTETENQIRDEILEKCASNYIRRKCYEEAQGGNVLTLSRTLEIAAQCEEIELQLAELSTGGGTEAEKGHVNRVAAASQKSDKTKTGKSKKNIQCYRCGKYGHMSKDPECPARGKTCSKCQGKDHFATVCRTKDGKKKHEKQEKSGESVKAVDEHYAFTIQIKRDSEPMLDIVAGNKPLKVLIDSGASCNIVGVDTWEDLKRQGIDCKSRATNGKKLYAYASEKPINVKGTFETTVECGSRAVKTSFMVIDGNGVPLLGKETAMNLGVLKIGVDIAAVADTKTMIAGQYPELFRGVGKLNTHQMKIHIREDAKPVAQPMRRIPFNLRGKVERKLDELMKADIIEPVVGPTNWLNPVVVAPKPNGEIRLCLDMHRANEAIVRERHPIPTVDEVLQDLNGSKVFSKLEKGKKQKGHLGVVGTKQNLRSKVWWPGIDKAAERYCRSCHGCQLVARPEPPEPVTPTQLPEGPWRDVAVDLMGPLPSGHSLLVIVDYYSRYQETLVMQSTTTEKVIECLEDTFARHGIPVTLKSDNGPQFVSGEFKNFCQDNNIEHCKTTPRWAQANGEVERQNRSLLKCLQIAQAEKLDWRGELRKYLFQYRSVAHTTTGRSPAELLFNRKLRTKIPENSSLQPFDQDVRDRDSEQKAKSKMYADLRRGAQPSEVEVGDHVLLKQDKQNKLTTNFGGLPHEVLSKLGNSLIVQSPDGVQYRRNTSHVHRYVSRENEDIDRGPDAEPELPAVRPEVSDAPPVTPAAPVEPLRRSQRTIQKPARYRE